MGVGKDPLQGRPVLAKQGEEDKALVMYMLVCSRTNGKLTITPATAIEAVSAETLFGGKACDIFSLTGQLVRKNAQSLKGLPAGIYVVGGKKVVVR